MKALFGRRRRSGEFVRRRLGNPDERPHAITLKTRGSICALKPVQSMKIMSRLFQDRMEGGRALAELLGAYAHRKDVLILALPRGGVPVAFEVAQALNLPMDIFVVRKLGLPTNEELAMGALASGNVRVLNEEVVNSFGITESIIEAVAEEERVELERRERLYRGDAPFPAVGDKAVLLVDDGLATGSTMRAAVAAFDDNIPSGLSWRFRSRLHLPAKSCDRRPTTSSLSRRPSLFMRSVSGIRFSIRRPTGR